jgi:hypothetical protein
MTRFLKALGLALVAAFALSAMIASAAQAQALKVTAASYPAVLTGTVIKHKETETEPFVHTFTTSGGAVLSCKKITFTSTITAATERLTVIPKYEECSAKIGASALPATVTMEDCDYEFHGGVTETDTDKFEKGEVDLVCPKGVAGPVIHIFETAAKHEKNESLCTLTVAPFTNKSGVTYTNTTTPTPDDVDVSATTEGIALTRTGSLLCGSANQTATYTGSVTLKAFEDKGKATPENGTLTEVVEGNQIGVTVSH